MLSFETQVLDLIEKFHTGDITKAQMNAKIHELQQSIASLEKEAELRLLKIQELQSKLKTIKELSRQK